MTTKTEPTMSAVSTDRIEKQVVLRAPRSRVWQAITDAKQFSAWFQMDLDSAFAEGKTTRGRITKPGYEQLKIEMQVQRIEPERYFAYRWHPYAIEPKVDYSAEPTTLVEFRLEDAADGTTVTIVESGFDRIPHARRAEAFRMNDGGWTGKIRDLERYVA
ncbi:MAG TPA: SRPBCC family protein [Gemmatimonadales bacterium]|nr:SRPBCC family protein [Gemmatimonadales bacterium]